MTRKFENVDYEATLNLTVSVREALPPNHLARFVVDVIARLDLSPVYARSGARGGEPLAPEILLGLAFYGYATGVFSSRKIEQATCESLAFRSLAGGLHPDYDTLAHFRKTFLAEIQELFVEILQLAQTTGMLKLGNVCLDRSKIHADVSKSHAVSYPVVCPAGNRRASGKLLIEREAQLRSEVNEFVNLGEQADQGKLQLPAWLVVRDEIALQQEQLENLAQAEAVLEARAQEQYAAEQAEYAAQQLEREEKARHHKRRPGGRKPKPPQPGPRERSIAGPHNVPPEAVTTARYVLDHWALRSG